jgi:hypothetical protein
VSPQRPQSHVTAEKALAHVVGVLSRAGCAVETVVNDYGEDLLVQTSHSGRMDASRLWFQVKGTEAIDRHRLRTGELRLSVQFEQAVRWSRSLDLVVVCLCDVLQEKAWFARPGMQLDEQAGLEGRRTMTLRFSAEDVLTEESATRLVWASRLEHFRHLFLSARNQEAEADAHGWEKNGALRNAILFELMQTLGLIEPAPNDPERYVIRDSVRIAVRDAFAADPIVDDEVRDALARSTITAILRRASEIDGELGLSQVVIEEASRAVAGILGLSPYLRKAEGPPQS